MLSAKAQVKQEKKIESIKRKLKTLRPHFIVSDGKTTSRLTIKCKLCGKAYEQWATHFLTYDCRCKMRGAQTQTVSKRIALLKSQMPRHIELVGDYKNANTKVKVRCTKHNLAWEAFPANLRKGHACRICGIEQRDKTNVKKYGCKNPVHGNTVSKNKRKRTMLSRYGVEHANQNPDIFSKMQKSSAKHKDYKLGKRLIKVQGYEHFALDYLIQVKKIKPSHIEAGFGNRKVPVITYTWKGKSRVYYPDIYLPKENRIVEVKSTYTRKSAEQQNEAKRKAVIKAGFKFSYLIMSTKGERLYEH